VGIVGALVTFAERDPIVQEHTLDVIGSCQHGLGPIVHATPDQDECARAGKLAETPGRRLERGRVGSRGHQDIDRQIGAGY
jgi:hypothetical protein